MRHVPAHRLKVVLCTGTQQPFAKNAAILAAGTANGVKPNTAGFQNYGMPPIRTSHNFPDMPAHAHARDISLARLYPSSLSKRCVLLAAPSLIAFSFFIHCHWIFEHLLLAYSTPTLLLDTDGYNIYRQYGAPGLVLSWKLSESGQPRTARDSSVHIWARPRTLRRFVLQFLRLFDTLYVGDLF